MKKMTFCEQNLERGTQEVLDYANNNLANKFLISTTRCLGECGVCFSNCIVDLHGKLLVSETPKGLLEMIENEIKNN